jgi:DNA repair protein RadC
MKDLSPDDRPREKLLRHGASALGDNELVAVIIGTGSRRAGALKMANDLLAARGGLHGLARTGASELTAPAGGIGAARAARILAAFEIGRRASAPPPGERLCIRGPWDAAAYLLPRFGSSDVERFGMVLLDTQHRVFRTLVLAVGTQNTSVIEPRDVFREATRAGAAAIVLFHTHPSGDPTPSADDVALTQRLASAGSLMGIDVVDHLIIGDMTYVSFKESRRL